MARERITTERTQRSVVVVVAFVPYDEKEEGGEEEDARALYPLKWTIVLGDGSTTTLAQTKRSRRRDLRYRGMRRDRPGSAA